MLAHRGYELLDERECRELLKLNGVGRIGLSIGALPAIFPVTYTVDGDSIVFSTPTGTQIAESSGRGVLAFETGQIDPDGRSGWSVLAVGMALELLDTDEWDPRGARRLFRLPIDLISGTRFVNHDGGRRQAA
ncbi:MAG TPA: pyridoxamine 5'-phosphate oxidase family protein [Acidimicrobiales bacterium]|nr:pyridoxamine 5'-phosphate oxidase family protein [Acidimicrobiales bacterium]